MSRNKQSMHAELETALSELHLSTERWEAILAAAGRMTERENRRRPLRTGLMAAAICAALAVTAVAVSPPLRETLIQFLGSFEPYAQEVEGVSATDQGIELRVVRVLADKNGGTAYLEAEDLVGERLHESAALESYRDPCIAYDAEADTVCPRAGRYRSVPDADGGCVYSRILPRSPRSGAIFRTSSVGTSDWRAAGYPDRSDREVHIGRETGVNQNSAGPRPDAGGIGHGAVQPVLHGV